MLTTIEFVSDRLGSYAAPQFHRRFAEHDATLARDYSNGMAHYLSVGRSAVDGAARKGVAGQSLRCPYPRRGDRGYRKPHRKRKNYIVAQINNEKVALWAEEITLIKTFMAASARCSIAYRCRRTPPPDASPLTTPNRQRRSYALERLLYQNKRGIRHNDRCPHENRDIYKPCLEGEVWKRLAR
jgi:hypothetical protein